MSVKILYHYTCMSIKKYSFIVFSYTLSQMKQKVSQTLKIAKKNCLIVNLLGVFLLGLCIFTMYIISYTTWLKMYIVYINSSVNIYTISLYFLHTLLLFIFFALYGFILKKIFLKKSIRKILSKEFISILSNKINLKDRLLYIFSLNFLKIFLLTSFFVLLPNFFYYINYNNFILPDKSMEILIYMLYISVCYNTSNCYVNGLKIFSKSNVCSFAYSFIILLLAKITVINLLCLLPYIAYNLEFKGINKDIYFVKKSTLNFLNKLPILHKFLFIKINNNNNNVFINTSIAKIRCNNILPQLNNSNVKYMVKINFSAFTMFNNKHDSVIISAIQSAKKTSSCLMFTYNDRSNFIAVHRLFVVNIPNIGTEILHGDELGFLPKSGYFNKSNLNLIIKSKPLEILSFSSNNVLLKNAICSKPLSDNAIIEKGVYEYTVKNKQEIPLSTDTSDILASINKYSFNKKRDDFINNISSYSLNPFVFMMNLPSQNSDDNGFNNGKNKGKRKATQEEIKAWDEENRRLNSQQLVHTPELDIFQDEDITNLLTSEELALQSSFIKFYNTIEVIDIDYELLKIELSIYREDLIDISSSICYFDYTNMPVDLDNLDVIPPALYRLITEYDSFFDEDSSNRHNVIQALTDLNDYLTHERKAAISKFRKEKAINKGQSTVNKDITPGISDNAISSNESLVVDKDTSESESELQSEIKGKPNTIWAKLQYSSIEEYEAAVKQRYDEICAEYYLNNRGDDINVRLLSKRARQYIITRRVKELDDKHPNLSDIKERRALQAKNTKNKDQYYQRDKYRILHNKTLSPEEKQIQLQARIKLHKDILSEYKIDHKK